MYYCYNFIISITLAINVLLYRIIDSFRICKASMGSVRVHLRVDTNTVWNKVYLNISVSPQKEFIFHIWSGLKHQQASELISYFKSDLKCHHVYEKFVS